MKQLSPQFFLLFFIYCFCMVQISCSEFPKPLSHSPAGLNIKQFERLAFCLNQWMSLSKQSQVAALVMEVCTNIFQNVQANKGNAGTMGWPFFLFRPRNGRNIENNGHYNIQKIMSRKIKTFTLSYRKQGSEPVSERRISWHELRDQLNDWAEPLLSYFILAKDL